MDYLSDIIVKLRKENNYSQEVLAEKLGVSRQAVSKWERNEASPDIQNIKLLADVFDVTIDELVGRKTLVETQNNNHFEEKRKQVVTATTLISFILYLILGYVWNGWADTICDEPTFLCVV